jgi:hypothetical protein
MRFTSEKKRACSKKNSEKHWKEKIDGCFKETERERELGTVDT